MSLTDGGIQPTMPVTPTGVNNGGWGGFGGDGWWIILFFIVLFGWGGNGFGGNRGGVTDGYILASDFANIERKLDGVNNGLCDGFFAQAQLINGVQQNLSNGFMSAELSRANQQSALMAQLFQMQMQSQECCCENRAAVAQVRYDMATQGCETRNTVQNAARDIIDNANGNSKAILDFLVQSKMRDLESENQSLKLAASQAAQNSYLVSALRPSPIPAYQVANPYCCNYGCGCSA